PEIGLIACEVFANSIASLLSRLAPLNGVETIPPNLRVHDDDARPLIRSLPDASIARAYLMFPDPWPKARHAKRRFVHPATLADLARILKPGGEWRIASDDPTYQSWVDQVFAETTLFTPLEATSTRPADWCPTRYEAKAIRAGRTPRYWRFARA
ncbi:MAG: tRNA (guanine-N7)-methyltransferase, partial [Acidiphilium sp.]|nr:tRNA (guanine-N7)-methyltransferase [Acidiphilium sp.]